MNTLLKYTQDYSFSKIKYEDIIPCLKQEILDNEKFISELLASSEVITWDNYIQKIIDKEDRLSQCCSVVYHLNSVSSNDELRKVHEEMIPLVSEYSTKLGQNVKLYEVYKTIFQSKEYDSFTDGRKKIIDDSLLSFKLSGVALEDDKKEEYLKIQQELGQLQSSFANNLLDSSNAWQKDVSLEQLEGLSDNDIAQAKNRAKDKESYVIDLSMPCYIAVMTYAKDRTLREEVYKAYCTRASTSLNIHDEKYDNTFLIPRILKLRLRQAELLSFNDFVEVSLASKMAESATQIKDFFVELKEKSYAKAQEEIQQIKNIALKDGIVDLEVWDISYYSEILKQELFQINDEIIKPYLPLKKVLDGLFTILNKLFSVEFKQITDFDSWHEDVLHYEIYENNTIIAKMYLDLHARDNKRGGAWMAPCTSRHKFNHDVQMPIAHVACNFSPKLNGQCFLNFRELETLFHEMGHAMHHCLTKVDYHNAAGVSGVAWDAVELPSQFLENWCSQKEALNIISSHKDTSEPLNNELIDNLINAKTFQSAYQMLRQIEFSLFDIEIHLKKDAFDDNLACKVLQEVRKETSVFPTPEYNRFQNSFAHIFAGGYSAGYYSYKWAEVLSADAFSLFEEQGIFDRDSGMKFKTYILEQGGAFDMMDLYQKFRGRKPTIDALLRHYKIG